MSKITQNAPKNSPGLGWGLLTELELKSLHQSEDLSTIIFALQMGETEAPRLEAAHPSSKG